MDRFEMMTCNSEEVLNRSVDRVVSKNSNVFSSSELGSRPSEIS